MSQPRFGGLGGTLHVTNAADDGASNYGLTEGALARHESTLRTTEAPYHGGTVVPSRGPPSYTVRSRSCLNQRLRLISSQTQPRL